MNQTKKSKYGPGKKKIEMSCDLDIRKLSLLTKSIDFFPKT